MLHKHCFSFCLFVWFVCLFSCEKEDGFDSQRVVVDLIEFTEGTEKAKEGGEGGVVGT